MPGFAIFFLILASVRSAGFFLRYLSGASIHADIEMEAMKSHFAQVPKMPSWLFSMRISGVPQSDEYLWHRGP
jgi:hypothetical protein